MTRNVKTHEHRPGIGGAVTGYNPRLIDFFAVLRPQLLTVREVPEDLSWQNRGVCAEVGGDLWFPERGEPSLPAKRVCRGCEVRELCLEYALRTHQAHGVWGGHSERERRRILRDREAARQDQQPQEAAAA